MAIGEILSKQLIVIKADTSQAKAAIKELSAEEQKAAKARVEAQERHNQALERSQQRFALYAAGAAAGWALISSSVKKYEEHLVSLGAKGDAELKKLRDTTGALTNAQNQLQYAIARVALEAAPAAKALADMAVELSNIVGGVAGVVAAAKNLPGAGPLGKVAGYVMKYGGPVNQARAFGSWATGAIGDVYDNIRATGTETRGDWNLVNSAANPDWVAGQIANQNRDARYSLFTGKTSGTQSLLGEEGTQAIQYIDQESGRLLARTLKGKAEKFFTNAGRGLGIVDGNRAPRGGRGGSRQYGDPLSEIFGYARDTFDQSGLGNLGDIYATANEERVAQRAKFGGLGGIGSKWQSVALPQSAMDNLDRTIKELEQQKAGEEKSAMEKIVGPIEQFDAYASAFTMVSDAATSAYEAIVTGSEGAGAAIKRVIGGEVMALGKSMLVHSLQEGAWAIADLARGNLPGAATHAKAGAAFLAGSVVAGGVAAALGAGGSSGGGAGGSYASAGGIGGKTPASAPEYGGRTVNVVIGDGFADNSPQYIGRRTRRALELAGMQSGYGGGQPG